MCYECAYVAASSTDPNIDNAIDKINARQPLNQQCQTFPYYTSSTIDTVNCNTKNATSYSKGLSGMPFTGWLCDKQTYTVTLKNYGGSLRRSVL